MSLYLCFAASLGTEVVMTPSSIILLSLLFRGNCLIICYRFVLLHIILSVICSISSGKHTAPFYTGHCLRIIVGDNFGTQPESGASFFQACGTTLTYLSLPKAQQAIQGQRKGGTGSYRLL